jgi:hypothetical protein
MNTRLPMPKAKNLLALGLLSFSLILFLGSPAFSCGARITLPLRYYTLLLDSWTLEAPTTVFGFDNVGLRKGHDVLHVVHDGQKSDVPIFIEQLDVFKSDRSMFARWYAEDYLQRAAVHQGSAPARVTFYVNSVHWVHLVKIEALPGLVEKLPPSADDEEGWDRLMSVDGAMFSDYTYLDPQTLPLLACLIAVCCPLMIFALALRCYRPD